MKKLVLLIVVCVINLLALTNSYGQTFKMPTRQPNDFNVKNYLPKIGPAQIINNSVAEKSAPTGVAATKLLNRQSQKATLVTSNNSYDIYKLPIDQMPCVVPNNSVCYKINLQKMNYAAVENMPNATAKQNWIPNASKK